MRATLTCLAILLVSIGGGVASAHPDSSLPESSREGNDTEEPTIGEGEAVPAGVSEMEIGAQMERSDVERYRHIPFAMALVTPLDSNSIELERPVLNHFAFNWIYGESDRVEGLQLSLAGQRTVDRLEGLQAAGAFDLVDGDLGGLQLAGAFNWAGGSVQGLQASGAANVAGGDLVGLQASGAWNHTSRSVLGLQAAGAGNTAGQLMTGVQAAGGFNYAPQAAGAQLAPVNVVGDLVGIQAGVVNVAGGDVSGIQVGVINYADEADFSIGLVGGTRAGGFHPVVWTSDAAVISTGLRADARHTFTTLSAGVYPFSEDVAWLVGTGLGLKFPRFIARLGFELDVSHHAVMYEHDFQDGYNGLSVARLMVRWEPLDGFSVFGGPALNVYVGTGDNRLRERPGYIPEIDSYQPLDDVTVEVWPGFAFGFSLL